MREARMTPVNHPSILRVLDYGEEHDLVYVVTDFVPGCSLREVLDREGAFSWTVGRPLLTDLISAVRALHTQGLLAFGLTPSIIRLISGGGRTGLVISSAGVSEVREVIGTEGDASVAAEQRVDQEAFYLAPELLLGEKPDGRSDIFTIGCIGYEMFTGRRPFEAAAIVDPRIWAPSLPEDAALCLVRCLARRPDQRFCDAIELEEAWSKTPDQS
jgi:serine/threonine-protein kinase